jgi:hypothetical protein
MSRREIVAIAVAVVSVAVSLTGIIWFALAGGVAVGEPGSAENKPFADGMRIDERMLQGLDEAGLGAGRLQVDDVLVAINGVPVGEGLGAMLHAVDGDTVTLDVQRRRDDGTLLDLVVIQEIPGEPATAPRSPSMAPERTTIDIDVAALGAPDLVARLSESARARPHRDVDGAVDGFRLSGVRRDSLLFDLFGLRSGDVVHSVAGRPLHSVDEAMQAWQHIEPLSPGDAVVVELTRRGRPIVHTYQMR